MPPLQPIAGRVPMYARDPITGDVFEVGGGGTNEVFIGAVDPYVTSTNSTDELWLDTSKTPPILKGRVNNAWIEVTAATQPEVIVGGTIPAPGEDKLWLDPGGVMTPPTPGDPIKALWAYDGTAGPTNGWHKVEMGGSEIEVSAVDPITVNPEYELWVDTAPAPAPVQTDEVVVLATDPHLTGGTQEMWVDTSLTPPLLKYWDGTAWVTMGYLPLAGATMDSNAVISWPNEAAPTTKLVLYGTPTSGFGFGVEGGHLTAFGSGFRVRQSSMTGTEWLKVDGSGLHPRTSIAGPMQNSWTGSVNYTVNPATVTCDIDATCPVAATGSYYYQFVGIPTGASGPRATITMHTKAMGTNYGAGLDCWVEARSGGVGVIFPGPNDGTQKAPPGTRIYTTLTWAR